VNIYCFNTRRKPSSWQKTPRNIYFADLTRIFYGFEFGSASGKEGIAKAVTYYIQTTNHNGKAGCGKLLAVFPSYAVTHTACSKTGEISDILL